MLRARREYDEIVRKRAALIAAAKDERYADVVLRARDMLLWLIDHAAPVSLLEHRAIHDALGEVADLLRRRTLRFDDGMEFDTSGELRIVRKSDGLYVVGGGYLVAVETFAEGRQVIAQMKVETEDLPESEAAQ